MLADIQCETGSAVVDFHTNNHIDPPFSHLWVWGLVAILVYYIFRSAIERAKFRRMARDADAAVEPGAPLALGARFVCGRVEYAEGESNAIAVHVEQHGTQSKTKNGWNHHWTETSRTIHARPFYVRRPNGERVRVEPGDKPLLVDKPDQMVWNQREKRTRIAKLTPGEEVIIQGVLSKGHDPGSRDANAYRSSSHGWIMKPARGERMEVSAEKLGERHRKRARAFGWAVVYLLIALAIMNLIFMFYHIRFFMGEDTCAQITKKDTYVSTDSKGRRTTHYRVHVTVDVPFNPKLHGELDDSDWEEVQVGMVSGFRYVPERQSASVLGFGTSTHIWTIFFAIIVGLFGPGIYTGTRDYRRWYEGNLSESGSGKLPDPPGKGS